MSPITSYGIILYRKLKHDHPVQLLYIWPKYSVNFLSFIKADYINSDEMIIVPMLQQMISRMSIDEQKLLGRVTNFADLCKKAHLYGNLKSSNFLRAQKHYYKLVRGVTFPFTYQNQNLSECRRVNYDGRVLPIKMLNLSTLLLRNKSEFRDIELGFPKGRKNSGGESEINCALREFEEETHINRSSITLVPNARFEENYRGSDNKNYRSVFFLARENCPTSNQVTRPIRNHEVEMTQWMPLDEAMVHIRPYHEEKRHIIELLDQKL